MSTCKRCNGMKTLDAEDRPGVPCPDCAEKFPKTKAALAALKAASDRMDAEPSDESANAWLAAYQTVGEAFAEETANRNRDRQQTARSIASVAKTAGGLEWIEQAVAS